MRVGTGQEIVLLTAARSARAFRAGFLAVILGCVTDSANAVAQAQVRQGFDMVVPVAPAPVPVGDTWQLVYELHLTNFAHDTLTLMGVRVLNDSSASVLAEFRGTLLDAILGRPGESDGRARRAIAPGMRAIIYFNLSLDEAELPRALRHHVEFEGGDESSTIEGGVLRIDDRPLLELGPPLRGGPWVAVHHPSWERGHRRVVYAIQGRARIPGRFAVDWMMPATAKGDSAPADARGAEVLAVADAVVIATRDGVAEPAACPGPTPVALQDASGNHVVLDLGGGRYAFYEHLKPGVLVDPGDRVRRGQAIGALGCTGSVSGTHLHFHVGDAHSPLAAEGVPYVLTDFHTLGVYDSMEDFRRGEEWRGLSSEDGALREPSFPKPLTVVRFPEGDAAR